MSEIVEIESSPAFAESELLATLQSRGIAADLVENRRMSPDAALATFRIEHERTELAPRLLAALEDAIARQGRPLVCSIVGTLAYAIHAPAA